LLLPSCDFSGSMNSDFFVSRTPYKRRAETNCTYYYEHSLLHWFKFLTANPKAKQFRLTQHLWVSTQISCFILLKSNSTS
jgi:hypothetical protein